MDFYTEWAAKANETNLDTVSDFLASTEESVLPLLTGPNEQLANAFYALSATPIERFLDVVKTCVIERPLVPADVPCFSNFMMGAMRLNELLEFEPEGLSFSDAGYQLMNSVSDGARKKYGENHSKLAAAMSLVTISYVHHTARISATAWGKYLTNYPHDQKKSVLQKLLLRDLCVKTIVKEALNGPANYCDAVSSLSRSTALRRRTNVKCLVEYVLTGTEYEDALTRINWECD